MTHQIIYGAGAQALRSVPVNAHGRPTVVTACTYRIVDLRKGEDDPEREVVAAGTAATIDTTSSSTSATCGKGTVNARKIPVQSTVGFQQGRHYLITLADGTREMFLCEGIGTGYLLPRDELQRQYATAATVRGLEVEGTFPSIVANDETKIEDGQGGPYAIDWTWDLDPSPRREIVWIIRQPDSLFCTEEDVLSIDPSLAATTGQRIQISTAIRQAAMEVRVQLQLHQIDPDNFHAGDALKLAVLYRTCWHLVRLLKGEENQARAEVYKAEAQKYLDNITIGQPPAKTVKTNPSTDTAPGGTSKPYNHWQVLS
ncbi:hypothetical protein [Nannocystis pusilla]|uniref:hypothetical protein n=1 Tax=Nannocystis pusilla TaxID=889268 RepID=UPI003DA35A94